MPITSEWHNPEKSILLIKYDGRWTLDDYYANFEVANGMILSVDHPVVSILDFSSSGPLPIQFLSVGQHSERAGAKNNIQIIVFGVNRYMEALADLFQRLFPNLARGMRLVRSQEEALATAQATLSESVP